MDDLDSYYQLLGLQRGASLELLKQTYRDLVQVWHPDRFEHNPRLKEIAAGRLKDINNAYDKLELAYSTNSTDAKDCANNSTQISKQELFTEAAHLVYKARESRRIGQLEDSEQAYIGVVELIEKICGQQSEHYINALAELLMFYVTDLKKHLVVEQLSKRYLKLQREALNLPIRVPASIVEQADMLYDLATLYQREQRYSDSCTSYNLALDLANYTAPQDHLLIVLCCNGLADVYLYQNQPKTALSALNLANQIQIDYLPQNHPYRLMTLANYADLHNRQNNALFDNYYREAISCAQTVMSNQDPNVDYLDLLETFSKLAEISLTRQNYCAAKEFYLEILHIVQSATDANDPKLSPWLLKYAMASRLAGDLNAAVNTVNQIITSKLEDQKSLFQAAAIMELGCIHCATPNYAEAESCFKRALEICESQTIPQYELTADVLENYANMLKSTKHRLLDAANMQAKAKVLRNKNEKTNCT